MIGVGFDFDFGFGGAVEVDETEALSDAPKNAAVDEDKDGD